MPLSFFRDFSEAPGMSLNANEKKVLDYIKKSEKEYDNEDEHGDCNLTLRIDVKFQKVKSSSSIPVKITNDPSAAAVRLAEDDITDKYPWDYQILTTRLAKRYSDFKVNQNYHNIRKKLEKNKTFAYERLLNPNNPKGGKKVLFNPNIQKEFDKHYTRNS